MIVVE